MYLPLMYRQRLNWRQVLALEKSRQEQGSPAGIEPADNADGAGKALKLRDDSCPCWRMNCEDAMNTLFMDHPDENAAGPRQRPRCCYLEKMVTRDQHSAETWCA
jgi:hypothetical protein